MSGLNKLVVFDQNAPLYADLLKSSGSGERLHWSKLPFHLLPNVFATPHFSAWTPGTIARRAKLMADNLDRLVLDEPLQRGVREPHLQIRNYAGQLQYFGRAFMAG